jgi:plastocyanin
VGAASLVAACSASDPPAAQQVSVRVDGGTAGVIGTAGVTAPVRPGTEVLLVNGNRDADTRSATHLLTSAPPGQGPPVFLRGVPNGAVWGACLGGAASASTITCPLPPVEGPDSWDGDAYVSLGALLAGEERTLRLSSALEPGRTLRLWCSLHPDLQVQLRVGEEVQSVEAPAVEADQARSALPAPGPNEVLVAPDSQDPQAELLAFVPDEIAIRAGESVTWRLSGPSPHTVELGSGAVELGDTTAREAQPEAPAGGWDGAGAVRSGFLSSDPGAPGGTSFTLRFTEPGRYVVHNRFHPQMTGTVVVTG